MLTVIVYNQDGSLSNSDTEPDATAEFIAYTLIKAATDQYGWELALKHVAITLGGICEKFNQEVDSLIDTMWHDSDSREEEEIEIEIDTSELDRQSASRRAENPKHSRSYDTNTMRKRNIMRNKRVFIL